MSDFTLMGVLNVTPDSFSDGGAWVDPDAATRRALHMADDGARIIDVGGESTRPGAQPVDEAEERRRTEPVIRAIHEARPGLVISIDTMKASVAEAAIAAGATYVNDVTALRGDPHMAALVASHPHVRVCLMHMLGEPRTMQQAPHYADVVDEVAAFLTDRLGAAARAGIGSDRIDLDPGIGFGKKIEHNLSLLHHLDRIVALGQPVVLGTSRKGMLGTITGRTDPADRVDATLATAVLGYAAGVRTFRVHDVAPHRDALLVAEAVRHAR
ncbi:MAG: dihydropteroate synthase [Solirubrobacteraceae bacterium]|nr:dihydropteroate synthase [Solirubrobacteraceae bacterium]